MSFRRLSPLELELRDPVTHYTHPLAPAKAGDLVRDLIWAERYVDARDVARSMMDYYNHRFPDEDDFERQDRNRLWAEWHGQWIVLLNLAAAIDSKRERAKERRNERRNKRKGLRP